MSRRLNGVATTAARALLDHYRPLLRADRAQVRAAVAEVGIDADTAEALRQAANRASASGAEYLKWRLLADRIDQIITDLEGDQP